jgi:high-affinity K+ transport system ATPase subunit B
MANKIGLTVFTAGLLFATVVFAAYALSAAQGRPATSTDFSAQQQQDNKPSAISPLRASKIP